MMLRARRLVVVFGLLAQAALLIVLGRMAWLTVAPGERDALRQQRLHSAALPQPAARGQLLDRHGRVLADSVETLRVSSYAHDITHNGRRPRAPQEVAASVAQLSERLSPLLGASATELRSRLVTTGPGGKPRLAYLGAPVSDPARIAALLALRDTELRRLGLHFGWERRYPLGAAAGNLVGVTNHAGEGAFGLEAGLSDWLAAEADGRLPHQRLGGFRVADAQQAPLAALDGCRVELTIDSVLQSILHEELAAAAQKVSASGGSAVLIEVATGDILGMVSVPLADPADGRTWSDAAQVFRPVQTVYSPGSTFKPAMLATALDLGLVRPDELVDCSPERGIYKGRRVKDTVVADGPRSLQQIMVDSSNVGMAAILTRLVPESRPADTEAMRPVHEVLQRLSVGQRLGLSFPAEAAGLITPLSKWRRTWTLVSVSFGYELSVTPVQMAAVTAALADGHWRRPRLVSAVIDGNGQRHELPFDPPVTVWSRETAEIVRGHMRAVVEQGKARAVAVPGVPVAGKTGTTVSERDRSREIHSYIALAPADAPRIALVVVLEEPRGHRYASQTVAAPTGAILRRVLPYLGLDGGRSAEIAQGRSATATDGTGLRAVLDPTVGQPDRPAAGIR